MNITNISISILPGMLVIWGGVGPLQHSTPVCVHALFVLSGPDTFRDCITTTTNNNNNNKALTVVMVSLSCALLNKEWQAYYY